MKNYTLTTECFDTDGIDMEALAKTLEGKGTFVNKDGLGTLTCKDFETFIKAEELIWNLSCGFSAEDWADMLTHPEDCICDVVEV